MRDSLRRIRPRVPRRWRDAASARPSRPSRPSRRSRRHRRVVVGGIAGALALLLAGGGVAFALTRTSGPGYRTATAEPGTVDQTVDTTGTVAAATRSDRAFPVAGTVADVAVAVGDTVTAGQVLASLDPTSLEDAVTDAEQVLADAQQQLEDDIDSQTSSSASSSGSTSGSTSAGASSGTSSDGAAGAGGGAGAGDATTAGSGTTSASGGQATDGSAAGGSGQGSSGGSDQGAAAAAVAAVTAAQRALLAQYDTAQGLLVTASDAVTTAQDTCRPFLDLDGTTDGGGEDTSGADGSDGSADGGGDEAGGTEGSAGEDGAGASPDDGTTSDGTATDAASTGTADAQEQLVACQDATAAVLDAQTAVDGAQSALQQLAVDLDAAVTDALAALSSGTDGSGADGTGTTPATETGEQEPGSPAAAGAASVASASGASTAGATGSGAAATSAGAAGGGSVASAADLLADQARIDEAEAALAVAQSRLALVDLTTPVAGTVAAVSIAAGDTVEAASTSAVVTVLGDDGWTVSTTVPLSQVDLLEVGQSADVSVATSDADLTGTVTAIGVLNASTSTADPSYTVDVALDAQGAALFDGSSAQVSIAVASSAGTLTVPSSAVHLDGTTATVQVLRDGVVADVEVERGAVGDERTEIVDGLSAGDVVVLADLGLAMESGDETSGAGLTGLSGSSNGTQEQVRGGMMGPGGAAGGAQGMAPPGS
ncbi:biotin/lipoyl-binding protein [Cellulomonas sp. C5510]|uniref:HlyD family efflux transporter periplasmic adaptor subunit n=1 Tax=Cellulomonas sp. C5510 TaxID=2871170 RepID=UPI001C95C05D|nr:biotin/lipoyl-binding protein [Cellulomonas sp. C5510]QZN85952.1 HlyD family efflux transporter periplasmic adaptor subunit [Cellulomonas sp. C5510]